MTPRCSAQIDQRPTTNNQQPPLQAAFLKSLESHRHTGHVEMHLFFQQDREFTAILKAIFISYNYL